MYSISSTSMCLTEESFTGDILRPREDFRECRLCVGLVNGGDQASVPCALLKGLMVDGGA